MTSFLKPIAKTWWSNQEANKELEIRFPLAVNASKSSRSGATSAKGSLTSGKKMPLQTIDTNLPAQPQSLEDLNLSAKLYSSLRILRTNLVKEAGEGVMAYHIFGNATLQQISRRIPRSKEELLEINGIGKAKITKYGDRLLETIEACIKDNYNERSSNSGSNDSTQSKRRRHASDENANNDDFIEKAGRSKKKLAKKQNKNSEAVDCIHSTYIDQFDDINFDDNLFDVDVGKVDEGNGGRVLPW